MAVAPAAFGMCAMPWPSGIRNSRHPSESMPPSAISRPDFRAFASNAATKTGPATPK